MSMVLVITMNLLPWVLGTAMLYALLREPRAWHSAEHLVLIGAGAYLGYITLAGLLYALLHFELSPFSWRLPVAWAGVLGLCWVLGLWRGRHGQPHCVLAPPSEALIDTSRVHNALTVVAGLWVAGLALWVVWEVCHNPLIGWDAVWVWGIQTNQQLTVALSDTPAMTVGGTHPATLVMVSMWSVYWSGWSAHAILGFAPWGVLYLGTLLVTLGLMLALTGSRLLAMVLTAMVMSAPMIESHAALGGYADLWVMGGLVAGAGVVIGIRSERKTPILWLTVLALVLSVATLKNNSMVFSAIVLLGVALAVLLTSRRAWLGYLASLGMLAGVAYLLTWGWSVDIGPLSAAYSPEAGTVRLGNRASALAQASWAEIGHNLWQAWWMASSYGVVFSAALIALPVATAVALIRKNRAGMVLLLGAWGMIAFLVLAQWVSEYFYLYATPGNDTGLTRFSHAVYWLVVVGVAIVLIKGAPRQRSAH